MLDVTTVGSDLTLAQQSETLSDLAFFLDEFGSTRAVRGKLQEQEKDIMRLERQVHQFRATVGRSQDEKAQEDTKLVENHEIDISEEGVDETMVDLDFFLRIYKSTRSVREKLVIQRRRIEDLHRTIQELEQIHAKDDSCDANCLGTGQKGENHAETRRVDVGETGGDSGNEIDGGGGDAFDSKVDVAAGEDAIAASPEHSSEGSTEEQHSTASTDDIRAKKVEVAGVGAQNGITDLDNGVQDTECGDEARPHPLYVIKNFACGGMVSGASGSKCNPVNCFRNDTGLCISKSQQPFTQGSSPIDQSRAANAEVNMLDRRASFAASRKQQLCQYPNCVKWPQMRGLCYAHGGYRECKVDGCNRKAATRHLCSQHGGRTNCVNNECGNFAISGRNGHCYKHAREHCAIFKKPMKYSIEDRERFGDYHGNANSGKFSGCQQLHNGQDFCKGHEIKGAEGQGLRLDESDKVSPLLASFHVQEDSASFQPNSQSISTVRAITRRGAHVTCKTFGCLKWVKRFGDQNDYCAAHRGASTSCAEGAPPTSATEAPESGAPHANRDKPITTDLIKDYLCKEPGCNNKGIGDQPDGEPSPASSQGISVPSQATEVDEATLTESDNRTNPPELGTLVAPQQDFKSRFGGYEIDITTNDAYCLTLSRVKTAGRVQQQMRDPSAVGSDLTPAQQDEVMADLAFFLDEFGSTRAVRTKLQEQESDIKRLDGIRIVGLQRTMKWLQERWNAVDESSSDVENLGTEPASKADKAESSKTNVESVNEDTDGTDNGSENEDADDEGDVVMVSTQQCENDSQEKEVEVVPAEPRNVVMISEECGASSSCSVADESDSSELTQAQQAFAEGSSATFEQKYRVDHGATAALKTVCPYLDCANYTQANHLCAVHGGFRTREVHGCIRKAVAQCRCRVHGGDRCKIDGCNTLSVYRGKGYCIRHARDQGALPKLVCKELGCNAFRVGRFYCREHVMAHRLKKDKQKNAWKCAQSQSVGGSESSSKRSHATCRAVGCMKWVKRNGDDNEYCVDHQCPSASRDDSPRGSIPGIVTSFFSPKSSQQQGDNDQNNNGRPTCKQPGCRKLGKSGVKKGFCFEHGGGYTCTQPGCNKERTLKGLCVAHGGFHVCKAEGCGKRVSTKGFCSLHRSRRAGSRPSNTISFDQYITMLDVKAVGADLTPEQRDETMDDLSFFLDEFSSTRALEKSSGRSRMRTWRPAETLSTTLCSTWISSLGPSGPRVQCVESYSSKVKQGESDDSSDVEYVGTSSTHDKRGRRGVVKSEGPGHDSDDSNVKTEDTRVDVDRCDDGIEVLALPRTQYPHACDIPGEVTAEEKAEGVLVQSPIVMFSSSEQEEDEDRERSSLWLTCCLSTCTNTAQANGLCYAHGGYQMCKALDCNRRAAVRGGSGRCAFTGCDSCVVSNDASGDCYKHTLAYGVERDGKDKSPMTGVQLDYCEKHLIEEESDEDRAHEVEIQVQPHEEGYATPQQNSSRSRFGRDVDRRHRKSGKSSVASFVHSEDDFSVDRFEIAESFANEDFEREFKDPSLCNEPGCQKKACATGIEKGYCFRHGGGVTCSVPGCLQRGRLHEAVEVFSGWLLLHARSRAQQHFRGVHLDEQLDWSQLTRAGSSPNSSNYTRFSQYLILLGFAIDRTSPFTVYTLNNDREEEETNRVGIVVAQNLKQARSFVCFKLSVKNKRRGSGGPGLLPGQVWPYVCCPCQVARAKVRHPAARKRLIDLQDGASCKEEGDFAPQANAQDGDSQESTMVDLDFFLRTVGLTRAVCDKLQSQRREIAGLRRTLQWLEERRQQRGGYFLSPKQMLTKRSKEGSSRKRDSSVAVEQSEGVECTGITLRRYPLRSDAGPCTDVAIRIAKN
ncbi:hypothetical protein ON010_g75 [Phytophthora cinnamomi]|nr:hypothetical protein ON010_g75 [Phytophthora cinnamomi]